MGYCVTYDIRGMRFSGENVAKCLKAINALHTPENLLDNANGGTWRDGMLLEKHYAWTSNPPAGGFTSLKQAFQAWRFDAEEFEDGNVILEIFNGEKLGDEGVLFDAIAPFTEGGTIEGIGEDGCRWRHDPHGAGGADRMDLALMVPQDCPYNIQRVTEFQAPCGEFGYEAVIREWGHRIGVLIAPPLPVRLQGFAGADAEKFKWAGEDLGLTPEIFAVALVEHFKALRKQAKADKTRERFEETELRRLEKECQKKGTLYRLKGFPARKWDWVGTSLDTAIVFLKKMHPDDLETVIGLASLKDPAFKLPY